MSILISAVIALGFIIGFFVLTAITHMILGNDDPEESIIQTIMFLFTLSFLTAITWGIIYG